MEQKLPIVTRKLWNIVRLAFYMLRKGICKKKILLDLNLMMKRGKLAGKTLTKLMFNHYATASKAGVGGPIHFTPSGTKEYEFSCSNTPLYRHYFNNTKKKMQHKNYFMSSPYEEISTIEDVKNVLEMMVFSSNDDVVVAASPALGFGKSPVVRQLRITDSPYPMQNDMKDNNSCKYVDEAADEFIKRFYSQLKEQSCY